MRWQHEFEQEPFDTDNKEDFIQFCAEHLKDRFREDLYCWVAAENGLIIAHIYIAKIKKVPKPQEFDGAWGYTTAVYCISEYRNKGIGSALMEKVKEWCVNQKLELLIVWPSERSVPFYERAGFNGANDVLELSFEY